MREETCEGAKILAPLFPQPRRKAATACSLGFRGNAKMFSTYLDSLASFLFFRGLFRHVIFSFFV